MLPPDVIAQMQQERTERARAGLAKGEFKFSAAKQGWQVVNGDGNQFSVTLTTCTCQDFADRGPKLGLRCKHIEAALILFPILPNEQPANTQTPAKNIPTQGENNMYLGNLPIIGHLGRDPEMRFTPSGKPVTNFSVAVNRQYTGGNGETVKETYWFKCTAWDKQAESCNQYLKKGSKVFIEGRLTADQLTGGPRIWTKQDGTPQASFELTIVTIKFLDSRSENADELVAPENDIPF
jgi:single-strand DNA-binding protein